MTKLTFELDYAGLKLTVLRTEQKIDFTPLKPISDLFGLRWKQQQNMVIGQFTKDYLGTCTLTGWGAGGQNREQICIRLDRVAAWMMGLSLANIHAKGNSDGAAFLTKKREEWADTLHQYESLGISVNPTRKDEIEVRHKSMSRMLDMMCKRKGLADPRDIKLADLLIKEIAQELGHAYAPDAVTEPGAAIPTE